MDRMINKQRHKQYAAYYAMLPFLPAPTAQLLLCYANANRYGGI
jgi:hypothetical protein